MINEIIDRLVDSGDETMLRELLNSLLDFEGVEDYIIENYGVWLE